MTRHRLLELLVGIAITVALGMGGAALKFWHDADIRLAKIEQRQADAVDAKQDKQIERFWRLHGWAKDEINELRWKAGLPKESWPDLD